MFIFSSSSLSEDNIVRLAPCEVGGNYAFFEGALLEYLELLAYLSLFEITL